MEKVKYCVIFSQWLIFFHLYLKKASFKSKKLICVKIITVYKINLGYSVACNCNFNCAISDFIRIGLNSKEWPGKETD